MDTAEKLQKFEEIYRNTEMWSALDSYHIITLLTAAEGKPSDIDCMIYLEVINLLAVTTISAAMDKLDFTDAMDKDQLLSALAEGLAYTEYMALMYQVGFEQAWRANAPQSVLDTMKNGVEELEVRLERLRASTLEVAYEAS